MLDFLKNSIGVYDMGCMTLDKKKIKTIQTALKALGKENFALIVHGGSFPALENQDTGFGTYNSEGGKSLMDYASGIFNAIQLGPAGKTKTCDSSPYTGTIFSGNTLFIDLFQLTTKEWGCILSKDTVDEIVEQNPNRDKSKCAYSYIYNKQLSALKEAWNNFKNLDDKKMNAEFEKFKTENDFWLSNDSLYEALSIEYGNDYWPLWKSEKDKNLLNPKSIEEKIEYSKRIDEIECKYASDIEFYKFCQYVLDKQNQKTKKYASEKGIKMIADRQVAFSDRDIWAYQSLFLEDWYLGCPPDYFSKDGQAWGFPVMDPEKLFKPDGTLGEAGLLMKKLYVKLFNENPGGVRIDHIVGLIDPWVYRKGLTPKPEDGAGRLFSSPEHSVLSKYAVAQYSDLDLTLESDKEKRVKTLNDEQIKLYGRFIEKIVIAAAEECGLDKNAIVCEDLGTLTNPVAEVMKKYELLGMRLTQFVVPEKPLHPYRCCNIGENCWTMVGTHDNEPIAMWADKTINTHEGYLHAKNLTDDLFAEVENKDDVICKLNTDNEFLTHTKLTELFASKAKNVQMFFTDFFKIKDVYNRPGTSGDANWSLRLPNNFAELATINLSEILASAIVARGKDFAKANEKILKELRDEK